MDSYGKIVLTGILVFAVISFWFWLEENMGPAGYIEDPVNPYRRYCGRCGQQQDQCRIADHHYWQSNGEIRNAACACHDHTE